MQLKFVQQNGRKIAVIHSDGPILTDTRSALDLMASIGYEHNCYNIALPKAAVSEDFFRLGSGFAGEMTQKFVNYGFRLALMGDFSGYTSKPLQDFIRESNRGNHLFFVAGEQQALTKLSGVE